MKDLTKGNEVKLMLHFVWPMMLGNLFQQLYNIFDCIIVGNYIGKEALAAVGASHPVIFALVSLIIGVTIGLSVVIAQIYGAKDYDKVKLASDTAYVFILISAVIITVIGFFFAPQILSVLKLSPEIIDDTTDYFKIFNLGLIFLFGFSGTHAILRGLGDSKTPLYFLLFSNILNVGLDLLFVVVLGYGIKAVAWATVISQMVSFFALALYINKKHPIIRISFKKLGYNFDILKKSLKVGLPTGLQQTFVAVGIMALVRIVNSFGADSMAAFTVTMRIDTFTVLPALSFSAALSMFVGQNIGADKIDRVYNGYWASWKINAYITLVITVLCIVFRREIIMIFNKDPNVIEIGADYLLIVSGFYIIFGSMFIVHGVLRGAGDTMVPMFITLFSLWIVRIPISYLLSQKIGVNGIWWGIPASWVIGFTLSWLLYKSGRWKKMKIFKYDVPLSEDTMRTVS